MMLPLDISRCSARISTTFHDGDEPPTVDWCPHRHTCQRFLAFTEWDRAAGLTNYRGVPVSMAVRDCQHKIEVEVAK